MYNEDLAMGLKEILKEKDLKDIGDFISSLFKYVLKYKREDEDIKLENVDKYLEFIEDYLETKQIKGESQVEEAYKALKPCLETMINDQDIYDLFAEKIEDIENSKYTREELIKIIDIFMAFTEIKNIYLFGIKEENELQDEENYELNYNLKYALSTIIEELSVKEFLELDNISDDPFFDNVVYDKIEQMNEEQLFKYLLKTGENSEIIEEKIEELESPALYNLYAAINYSNYIEEYDKLNYLAELRNSFIVKSIKGDEVSNYDEDDEYDTYKISTKLSRESINLIRNEKDFKLYLDKLSKLNNNELTLYLIDNIFYINENEIEEEMNLLENRIKKFSDIELETLYSILHTYNEGDFVCDDEMKKRNLLVTRKEKYEEGEYEFTETRDFEQVAQREAIYEELSEFIYNEIIPQEPQNCSDKVEKAINICKDSLIKNICKLDKFSDLQCIQLIQKINQTETYGLYENADEDFAAELEGKKEKMTDEQLIENYKQRCKYQIITYLYKRIISMQKKYLALVNITNKNGVFNDVIEMALEEVKIRYNDEISL